jgi:hypothetical protein
MDVRVGPRPADRTRMGRGCRAPTRAPHLEGRGLRRRASIVALLVIAAVAVFAAEAQAYVSGDLIYAKRIGTSSSEAGSWTVAAGPDGMTAVAGWKNVAAVGQVPMVAKYNVSGTRKWLRTYTAGGTGSADAVAVDSYANVYVAATVDAGSGSGGDIVLLKYAKDGTLRWTRVYDGPANDWDYVEALIIDKAGNIIVVGQSKATAEDWGIVALKYSRGGDMLWAGPARFDPDPDDDDAGPLWVYDAARDADGNIYVAGSSEYRVGGEWIESALMLEFAAADGARQWGQVYAAHTNPESYFGQVAVRGTKVIGVGSTWVEGSSLEDALAVRYNLSGTEKYWKEWGVGNARGEWYGDAVIDGNGNTYVTGGQWSDVYGWEQAVTMKLRPDLSTAWKAVYRPTSDWAEGWYLVRNSSGNIYVAGARWTSGGLPDILTIKYSSTGARKWVRIWSAGGPGDDDAEGIVLGTAGGVYVAGEVTNKDDFDQAVLLKYKL